MDVSIIIVNYNTCKITQDCIDSIFDKTSDVNFEIIIVDNASTDGSKEHFEKQDEEGKIRYIYSYENMGFGRANNVGMMLAKGEFFFLLNSDTYLLNNAILEFLIVAKKNSPRTFWGSYLLNEGGAIIHSAGENITIKSILNGVFDSYLHFFRNVKKTTYYGEFSEVGYITGADMFFHRSLYEISGGFDHNYFMYYEESDWQIRMKKLKSKSILISSPRIVHLDGGSQIDTKSHFNEGRTKRFINSQRYFVKKHYNYSTYIVYRILNGLLYFPIILFSPKYTLKDRLKRLKITII